MKIRDLSIYDHERELLIRYKRIQFSAIKSWVNALIEKINKCDSISTSQIDELNSEIEILFEDLSKLIKESSLEGACFDSILHRLKSKRSGLKLIINSAEDNWNEYKYYIVEDLISFLDDVLPAALQVIEYVSLLNYPLDSNTLNKIIHNLIKRFGLVLDIDITLNVDNDVSKILNINSFIMPIMSGELSFLIEEMAFENPKKHNAGKTELHIDICEIEESFFLRVTAIDDGLGIPEDKIKALNLGEISRHDISVPGQGIALNSIRRKGVLIKFLSQGFGKGTTVVAHIPLTKAT